ncbi:phosphatidylinositol-specific phospholipase C domain-containing protein [Endozoicomonas arenosclerae]|uniref:phosphatidylinositol-specific phospholipase C domain-containing protein n=1 Tax=Endozoicomonas arenosclerae TaxID=1633495 RepID=UPI0009A18856|nr:phosphatidylinositol-specific phospholipase C domain-containing protein [Endozoicomonas arenosclerae]
MTIRKHLGRLLQTAIIGGLAASAQADKISDFEKSWTSKALAMQRQLDSHAPIINNSILGTHNTYNSEVYRNALRYHDPQQKYSIYDQLRMGARFIELDAHWTAHTHGAPWKWGTDLLLCHSGIGKELGDLDIGCSLKDRRLTDGLQEVRQWLNSNPNEVIILYIEDHTNGKHSVLRQQLNSKLGGKIFQSGGCKPIGDTLTKAQVLEAGKQVILWKDKGCANDGELANMAFSGLGKVSRIWEDGTTVAKIVDLFTSGGGVDRIEAHEVAESFAKGVNIVNLDDMVPGDRIDAAVWSWARNEPNNHGGNQHCAVSTMSGRWDDQSCSANYYFACQSNDTGEWALSFKTGPWNQGSQACAELGNYRFSVPTNSQDNERLKSVKGSMFNVWLNYHDQTQEGVWQIPSQKVYPLLAGYRELRDQRSNLCLDVEGGNRDNGTNVRLWKCNGSDAQKWTYDSSNGFLRSKLGKCLDNRGQTFSNGEIVIWECLDNNNLRFDWVGNSLRSRHDASIAVDAYGDWQGAKVGQWQYHGGKNQQWQWGN